MTSSRTQPDPDGLRYEEHWQPVLAAAASRLLDRIAALDLLADGDEHPFRGASPSGSRGPAVLDVGTGTGSLALAAARRWPAAHVTGLDASAAMLSVARCRGAELAGEGAPVRFRWLVADATRVPLEDATTDVALSSFVLQLVDDRLAVLREIARVVRPGGAFGFVTWLAEELQMAPDVEFDEAVYDLELEEPDGSAFREPKPGDYESLEEAADELRGTGLDAVDVRADELTFTWTRAAYRRFKEDYDERELFESLSEEDRRRLLARVDERWSALPDDAFTFRAPLVSAVARRPAA